MGTLPPLLFFSLICYLLYIYFFILFYTEFKNPHSRDFILVPCPCDRHPLHPHQPIPPSTERAEDIGPEMRSLLPLSVYCISLVSLQQLLLALPAQEQPGANSLDLLNELMDQSNDEASPSVSEDVPATTPGQFPEQLPGVQSRRASPRVKTFSPSLAWALPGNAPKVAKRVRRARNGHTGARGGHHNHHHPHHGQLMRVGCVLGTCQVQNLSHRLYQLIGQSGREDSSPINPRSPHSFG